MNFFESQDRARKHTFQLVSLFALAVVSLIIMTNLLVMVVFGFISTEQVQSGESLIRQIDWRTFATVSAAVAAVVLVGSFYKMLALSAGGKAVAESLGGKLIPRNTNDPQQRKLLNVVEEISIASGTPAPPVYVLADEAGINAFAAGFSPRDAVIGVTQGTIDHLSREQLQGVIAHEFSHIFNGDMRLNIRLIGVLNGILIIGILGYYLLYSASFSRRGRSNDKGAAAMLALAIGLMVIGYAGTFFGGLIKAAVSRQREYLADASAVQFTRNPDGIAGALKRIGGLESGSKVENPAAAEISHAFFAQGVSGFMQALSATHPPLDKRILRIDPHWDGKFDTLDKPDSRRDEEQAAKQETMTRAELAQKVATVVTGAAMADVANAIDQIGNPSQETISYARDLVAELPIAIKEAAREPYGARAVIYSLVLDKGQPVRDRQLKHLQDYADVDVYRLTRQLAAQMKPLDIKYRLVLIDIAIPALKQLSLDQYQVFRDNLGALIEIDARVEVLEWTLQKILFNHLDDQFFKLKQAQKRSFNAAQLKPEIELLLSVMAYAGDQDPSKIETAFAAAANTLEISGLRLLARNDIKLSDLDRALQQLANLKPLQKPQLLLACATSAGHDQNISTVEVEVLRAFADVLDCPMPPIIK
ncbi:MAG: M48 family metallopeptidase [Gammaproteobacteria bacterium]|jgi:Zn-dependent protease with chaperone function|nr:M48 family metallopeptidase [Gammaproteobacteria bacterium]